MLTFIQEMFDRIDKEEDGEVYLREVVDYLAVLDNNIQQSLKVHSLCTLKYEICFAQVNAMLMDYRTQKDRVLNLKEFSVGISTKTKDEVGDNDDEQEIMDEIKEAGWTRFKPEGRPITEKDMRKVFRMVDMDKSGHISQLVRPHYCYLQILHFTILSQELKLGLKYLAKRYRIDDASISTY